MHAQVGGVAVAHAPRRSCEVQARHRDLGTLGFCGFPQGAAGYADLLGGAGQLQLHTPVNFPQARQQFRRVLHRLSVEDGRPQGGLQWLARCLRRSIIGQSETCRNASVSCRCVSAIMALLGPSSPWNTPSTATTWNIRTPFWKPDKPVWQWMAPCMISIML